MFSETIESPRGGSPGLQSGEEPRFLFEDSKQIPLSSHLLKRTPHNGAAPFGVKFASTMLDGLVRSGTLTYTLGLFNAGRQSGGLATHPPVS
jgi:hypothetical protein